MKSEQEWEKELHDILEKLRNNSINEIKSRRKLDANGAKVLAKALKVNARSQKWIWEGRTTSVIKELLP